MPKRMLLGALAALATMTVAAPASANPVGVAGCYGVTPAIVCNPTVDAAETYKTSFEVCTGTCQPVEVTLVRTSDRVCVSYTDRAGNLHDSCVAESSNWYNDDYYYGGYGDSTCTDLDVPGLAMALCYGSRYYNWSGKYSTCVWTTGPLGRSHCS